MRNVLLLSLAAIGVLLTACTQGAVKPNTISYALNELDGSGVTGTVTFEKLTDRHTAVVIDVDGLDAGTYPAHIHVGDHPGGNIYISLNSVSGSDGTSATIVTHTDAGAAVDYEHLINYDGYVNVHAVGGTPVIATGETGQGADDVQVNPR